MGMSVLRYGGDPAKRLLLAVVSHLFLDVYKDTDSMNPPVSVLEALKIWREVAGESTAGTQAEQTHLLPRPSCYFVSVTVFTDVQNPVVKSC